MLDAIRFHEQYGSWAVIAGASEGLGAAYAEQLAKLKLNLVLIARRTELLNSLAQHLTEKYQIQVKTLALDLSLSSSAETTIQNTQDLEVGLVIYNAAFSAVGPFHNYSLGDHLREIDTNIRTPLALTYLFGERMLAQKRGGILLM